MRYYLIERFDEDGGWEYYVFADDEQSAKQALCRDLEIDEIGDHKIYGPHEIEKGDVLIGDHPNL